MGSPYSKNSKELSAKYDQKYLQQKIETISEEHLTKVPPIVQKYLAHTGIVGKPISHFVKLKQSGLFKTGRNAGWQLCVFDKFLQRKNIQAEQVFNLDTIEFTWWGSIGFISATDSYMNGEGSMAIRMQIIPLVTEVGPQMNQSALMRFLSEFVWIPDAFLRDYVTWEGVDDLNAKATITNKGQSVSLNFTFKQNGEIEQMQSLRYNSETKKNEIWQVNEFQEKQIDGKLIPFKGNANWKYPQEDFCYYQVEINEIEYNPVK